MNGLHAGVFPEIDDGAYDCGDVRDAAAAHPDGDTGTRLELLRETGTGQLAADLARNIFHTAIGEPLTDEDDAGIGHTLLFYRRLIGLPVVCDREGVLHNGRGGGWPSQPRLFQMPNQSDGTANGMTSGPRDYLAAERTFLAWIRTGLALMGFGFVVARFGLFLRALQTGHSSLPAQSYGFSFWAGTTLIVLGVIVNTVSVRRHVHLVQELKSGGSAVARPSSLAIIVALILAVVGLAMAIYLIAVREPKQASVEGRREKTMASNTDPGIVSIPSNHSVDQTVEKVKEILQAKGVKLFASVDHSGEAERAGMRMRPTKLLIFGNPKAGTPLMIAAPSIAIDLPLKILVWEDSYGNVWISYNSAGYLQARHSLPQELVQNIAVVEAVAAKAAD